MTITGLEQMDAVAAALQAAASDLRKEVQAALLSSKPVLAAHARASALERLPKHGGLNRRVAADAFVIEERSSILQAGIRFGTASSDARGSNQGRIRHPVFGNRAVFVEQGYGASRGWFDAAMQAAEPEVTRLVTAAMESVARKATT
jgi:hypothetical protein